jgi:hypothetical protein
MRDRNSDERLLDSLVGGRCERIEFKKSWFEPEGVGRARPSDNLIDVSVSGVIETSPGAYPTCKRIPVR